jgi:hypothetical protein
MCSLFRYHHLATAYFCWLSIAYDFAPGMWIAALNCEWITHPIPLARARDKPPSAPTVTVHSPMYTYYFLSAVLNKKWFYLICKPLCERFRLGNAGRADIAAAGQLTAGSPRAAPPSSRRCRSRRWPSSAWARPGRLSGLSVSHSESILYGTFVWGHRPLNSQKRRFPARQVS